MLKTESKPKSVCFKRWSRKRFSVLLSLAKTIKIGVLCLAYSLVNKMPVVLAQTDTLDTRMNTLELEEVEITGRRSQVIASEVSRTITIIQRQEIEQAGIQSITDLLEYVSNVDIRQRGNSGVQADISIRGGSFDHVMVLVNGINLSDPQTGHLSLDLPIDHETIERIEVLEGPAARILGPGAYTGAVNIITRTGYSNEIAVSQTIGEYRFRRNHLHAALKAGTLQNFFSASYAASDGYSDNTDFTLYNLYYRGNWQKELTAVDFQSGYQTKKFGAEGFYSSKFPHQYEETDTWFGSLKVTTGQTIKITPHVYWRRKHDHFILERDNPASYENYHLTDVYGSAINLSVSGKHLTSTVGFDIRSENIMSNNIGLDNPDPKPVDGTDSVFYTKLYSRTNFAFFQEYALKYGNLRLTAGLMMNWNTGFSGKPFLFPGLDASYIVHPRFILFANVNRALHLPTFTDMFYKDPVNQGNYDLEPNRMISYEGGIKFTSPACKLRLSGFYNAGRDVVDWLWSYTSNRFRPVNLAEYNAWGISSGVRYDLSDMLTTGKFLPVLTVNYIYLDISKSVPDSVSKYYNLKHKLSVIADQQILQNIHLSWGISYQFRYGETMAYDPAAKLYYPIPYEPYWLMDAKIEWNIKYFRIFLEVSNILNTRYIDAGLASQPGRWFKGGLVASFPF